VGIALVQSLGVIVLAFLGALAGIWFGRRTSRWWIVGFIAPLVLILLVGLPRRHYPLSFVPPFSWLVAGRIEFALVAPLACMLMATPISRLKERRTRWLAGAFVAVFVVQASVLPFLMPAIQRDALSKLETRVGRDGVCKQSTDYTAARRLRSPHSAPSASTRPRPTWPCSRAQAGRPAPSPTCSQPHLKNASARTA
jgi:hypothetical protein